MDIRELFGDSVKDRAERLEAAMNMKSSFDTWMEAGFSRKEALELLKQVLDSTIRSNSETEFAERLARGEYEN